VQLDSITSTLKSPATKRLKLLYDEPPSIVAFKFNLRRYSKDANDPSIGMPRGEVLIGGPMVCQGYYTAAHMKDPELEDKNRTEFSVIDGVRYFHTGDIGAFTAKVGRCRLIL